MQRTKGRIMKKLLLVAAVTMAATSAFASKARVDALGNAAHLVDTQTIFENPAHVGVLGDFATFEFGSASSYNYKLASPAPGQTIAGLGATPSDTSGAEGGFIRSAGDSKWGFYLGHKSSTIAATRSLGYLLNGGTIPNPTATPAVGVTANATFLGEQNPIELFYGMKGDLNWGASLFYSSSDRKSTQEKQNSIGVRVGAYTTQWEAYLNLGLGAEAKSEATGAARSVKSDLGWKLGGGYYIDTLYVYGDYGMQGAKVNNNAGTEVGKLEGTELNVGVLDTRKQDGADFFYGISYGMYKLKNKVTNGFNLETTYLPVVVGVEADAASWLTVRASLQQNVLLGNHKFDAGTGGQTAESDTWNNTPVVAGGLGAKWNKFIVDGTLKAATNGGTVGFDGNNFLGQASVTYMF